MSNAWKIYMLAIISFLVGTSEFIIAGILDKVAADVGVSVSAAGQLITVFSLAYAFGTPILMALLPVWSAAGCCSTHLAFCGRQLNRRCFAGI